MNVAEKPILITGCSTGIGLASAIALQARGYPVYTTARKPEDIKRLQQLGFACEYLDYTDSASIQTAFQAIIKQTGGHLFALFNNGAYGQPGAVEDLSRAALELQFHTNVFGWHELTQLVLPVMRKQGFGRVIQNSSVLGFVALKYRGAYIASKYAIEGLTDTLRLEFLDTNIHFSLIEPGPIRTCFRENALAKFIEFIDCDNSVHQVAYQKTQQRLANQEVSEEVLFTLPASAVPPKVIHALESSHPKARYRVTFPTYLFAGLKRLLSTRRLDAVLNRV